MNDTLGTLELKIFRLRHQLQLLNQQRQLSLAYPDHQTQLAQKMLQLQNELTQLIQHREQLSRCLEARERSANGTDKRERAVYSVS